MSALTLVIGNKNYSSWSMRPWLVLRQAGIPFEELRIPLYTPDTSAALARWSPSGKVPVLHDGELVVWDSLAICEYLAERYPDKGLWPADAAARAVARSVSAEMHAGFAELRSALPMNSRRHITGRAINEGGRSDIARVTAIWNSCRSRFGAGGPFLFGGFTIADAMFAPVVLRFATYGVVLEGAARAYADAITSLPAIQEWLAASREEAETIEAFEL
ncbi:MAG TPA: glutathione S-transferase family protein [Gammaproteobacteria bacterium]